MLKWYDVAVADAPVPCDSRCWRASGMRAAWRRECSSSGRPRLRHPAPLRRRASTSSSGHLGRRQRDLVDGLGEERRGRGLLPAVAALEGRMGRRSASGSSVRCGTSSRHGAASSAPRATRCKDAAGHLHRPGVITPSDLRDLALGLPEATEADHHGKPSFRVAGKISRRSGATRRSTSCSPRTASAARCASIPARAANAGGARACPPCRST